jgi:hypothetical protein
MGRPPKNYCKPNRLPYTCIDLAQSSGGSELLCRIRNQQSRGVRVPPFDLMWIKRQADAARSNAIFHDNPDLEIHHVIQPHRKAAMATLL